jgi:hypothetical protein
MPYTVAIVLLTDGKEGMTDASPPAGRRPRAPVFAVHHGLSGSPPRTCRPDGSTSMRPPGHTRATHRCRHLPIRESFLASPPVQRRRFSDLASDCQAVEHRVQITFVGKCNWVDKRKQRRICRSQSYGAATMWLQRTRRDQVGVERRFGGARSRWSGPALRTRPRALRRDREPAGSRPARTRPDRRQRRLAGRRRNAQRAIDPTDGGVSVRDRFTAFEIRQQVAELRPVGVAVPVQPGVGHRNAGPEQCRPLRRIRTGAWRCAPPASTSSTP